MGNRFTGPTNSRSSGHQYGSRTRAPGHDGILGLESQSSNPGGHLFLRETGRCKANRLSPVSETRAVSSFEPRQAPVVGTSDGGARRPQDIEPVGTQLGELETMCHEVIGESL